MKDGVRPSLPRDRQHRARTFKNRELGAVVRAVGDVFAFARAARVSVQTVYRWAGHIVHPRAHLAARVNELARARLLPEPYILRDATRFRGRGKLADVVRAYGGLAPFARRAGASQTAVRAWMRDRKVRPLPPVRERVNALAREAQLAEPFPGERAVRFRGRGALAGLVRAYGGVAGLARAARVGETSVYRWAHGRPPWRSVAADVNALARARDVTEPFNLASCPVKTAEVARGRVAGGSVGTHGRSRATVASRRRRRPKATFSGNRRGPSGDAR
jgi:hypothetical protein